MSNAIALEALAKRMKANHLKLAQGLAQGMSYADAYRHSGGKGKDANKLGSELNQKNPDIGLYAELAKVDAAKEAQKTLIATKEQKRALLWKIAEHNAAVKEDDSEEGDEEVKMVDPRATIAAITELNKMDGDLAAFKTEIVGNATVESLIAALTD